MDFYFTKPDYDLPEPQPGLIVGGDDFEFSFTEINETHALNTTPFKHLLRLYADIGLHVLPEAVSEYRLGRYNGSVDVYPIKDLRREPDGTPRPKGGINSLAEQIEGRALLLGLIVPGKAGANLLSSRDFRLILDLMLFEDEMLEREGSEANYLSLRTAIGEADNRRKQLMDRMRSGGRVVAIGNSLDEVLRKVRTHQAGDM